MDFWTAVERVGIPMAILSVFAIAVWRVLMWIGREVVKPITASHIALVESTKVANEINSHTLQEVAAILKVKAEKLDSIEDLGDRILVLTTKSHQLLLSKSER